MLELAQHWGLDPKIDFLNHGSFGACPRVVLEAQQRLREHLEREPVNFMLRELEPLLDAAREALAALLGADSDDLAFVGNATTGVNTVLRSLSFRPGDELLTTSHAYNACANALGFVAERAGATVVTADVPFPIASAAQVIDAVLAAVTARTRLVLIDHVTSPTALVLPIARLVAELDGRGIDTLVDGAHAPGMVPVDLNALNAAYYTGNCHKWLCAPKGAAFLHVRRDRQDRIRPLVISHGASNSVGKRSRFRQEFDWVGTTDPSAYLVVPDAIRFMQALEPHGLWGVMERNRNLALQARTVLLHHLEMEPPAPEEMLGAMATVALPQRWQQGGAPQPIDPLQEMLYRRHGIEVPVFAFPARGNRCVRVSAQAYNRLDQYERLARVIATS